MGQTWISDPGEAESTAGKVSPRERVGEAELIEVVLGSFGEEGVDVEPLFAQ